VELFLKKLCGSFNSSFKPDLIRADFEISAHIAIKFGFLKCKIFGCNNPLSSSDVEKMKVSLSGYAGYI